MTLPPSLPFSLWLSEITVSLAEKYVPSQADKSASYRTLLRGIGVYSIVAVRCTR